MVRLAFVVGVMLVVLGRPDSAAACTCMPSGPPCQHAFLVDAAFSGTVRTISAAATTPGSPFRRRAVVIDVDRTFRGTPRATVQVTTGVGGGDCGYDFKVGERYLVYAHKDKDGGLSASICSRTRPIAEAAEDLAFFGALAAGGAAGGRVYGVVTHRERDLATGATRTYDTVPPVHLLLRGAAASRDAITDEHGRYEMTGIPPGKYELQVIPPAEFDARNLETTLQLTDARACAAADFGIRYDGRIRGIVLGADGQPVAGLAVTAIHSDMVVSAGNVELLTAKTDGGGAFELGGVPPGRYMVGVNLRRSIEPDALYPQTFYPGTPTWPSATVVTIGEGTHETLAPLRLPPARRTLDLTGVVVWPDGRPVENATVWLSDGQPRGRQVATGVRTGADGRFRFVVHEGLTYAARAVFNIPDDPEHRQVSATSDTFVATAESPPRLTLTLQLRER